MGGRRASGEFVVDVVLVLVEVWMDWMQSGFDWPNVQFGLGRQQGIPEGLFGL
jgi:hypothetical protein